MSELIRSEPKTKRTSFLLPLYLRHNRLYLRKVEMLRGFNQRNDDEVEAALTVILP